MNFEANQLLGLPKSRALLKTNLSACQYSIRNQMSNFKESYKFSLNQNTTMSGWMQPKYVSWAKEINL